MRYGGLIIAVVLAAVAAIVVLRMNGGEPQGQPNQHAAAPDVKTVEIYVAAKPIPVGTVITSEMIAPQPWPEHLALSGFMFVKKDAAPIEGMVARAPFQQSEPIIASKLANPSDPNFLAGELPKGMRVVTIPVNEVDGLAGFIFPGDHVDVIFTHDVEIEKFGDGPVAAAPGAAASEKEKKTLTETILTNVKVLAVDQRASNADATDKNGTLVIPKSASLMVSQADAQRVRLAQKTGTVSLVLRALADKESADPLVITRPQDISQFKGGAEGGDGGVKVVRGAPVKNTESINSLDVLRGSPAMGGLVPASPNNVVNSATVSNP